jgi:hypothetical protein
MSVDGVRPVRRAEIQFATGATPGWRAAVAWARQHTARRIFAVAVLLTLGVAVEVLEQRIQRVIFSHG